MSSRLLTSRQGGVLLFVLTFLAFATLLRLALVIHAGSDVTWDSSLLAAFAWGLLYDLATADWASIPVIVVLAIAPARLFTTRWAPWLARAATLAWIFTLVFGAVAEFVFWEEFGTRFNFVTVDYLVYTQELLGNVRESYPLPLILSCIVAASIVLTWAAWRTGWPMAWLTGEHRSLGTRLRIGAACVAAALALGISVSSSWLPRFANNYNREIAKNGLWSFVAAFKENELRYDDFYLTRPIDQAFALLRDELVEDGSVLLRPDQRDSLRLVTNEGPEIHPNVIQITVESLSATFVGALQPESQLTPNLDALARQSLVFDNFYATGTRTDRGMEALTLSLPPTPGRSIVKRPHDEGLFTLGSVFRSKGYDTAFLYGGYGYFDSMNHYFGSNGYRVIDRNQVATSDVTFANVWGACDEDLYRWTLREADAAHAAGKPFHFFVMTTSNHRPYTFPDGRIDMPSKVSGRKGAVKYTDFAIGELLRQAATRPWFRDTVFVIVADHCALSAGKATLPLENYHIPLFIFAPGGQIAPGHIATLTSQMDYAPTLLGLLNWTYPSRFFGHDVRRIDSTEAHALIGSYQMLGHVEGGELVILEPRQGEEIREVGAESPGAMPLPITVFDAEQPEDEAIAFYQTASYMFRNGLYRELTPGERASLAQR